MLIIGINLNTLGDRYISRLVYNDIYQRKEAQAIAAEFKLIYDEVYIIEIDTSNKPFIDYIVCNGCRI